MRVGYAWSKPATVYISLSWKEKFFATQVGTLIVYADWENYE